MFIIFRLRARSNNLRNEISKKEKIYFRDCGVRNAVINAYEDMDIRQDIGQLRENFCIIESIKYLYYSGHFVQHYFWRNYQGQEVDYMYTENSKIFAFECKWNSKKKVKVPPQFQLLYPHATFDIIHPQNYDTLFR